MYGYECPRCDKELTKKEVDAGKCSNCKLEFTVSKDTDVSLFKEDQLMSKLASEVFGVKGEKINITKVALQMMVNVFKDVVYSKTTQYYKFYKVENGLLKYHLWRMDFVRNSVTIYFDQELRGIEGFTKVKRAWHTPLGRYKGFIKTDDLDFLMEVCEYVIKVKARKFKKITYLQEGISTRY